MRVRSLTLIALGATFMLGAAAPAFADGDWRRQQEWREHAWREHDWRNHDWREHAWREHEWREHEWRERQRYYAAPPVYYGDPGYYR